MATTGLVTLAESLLSQTSTAQELQTVPATTGTGTAIAGAVNTQAILDEFVPSSQTGAANATSEAAGLFTAAQIPLFTAAANSLLGQSTATQTNPAVAPGNTGAPLVPPLVSLVEGTTPTPIQTITTTPAPAAAAPAAATLAVAVGGVQASANGTATAVNVAPVATTQQPAAAATAASTNTLASQAQLQTLNNSLAALGVRPPFRPWIKSRTRSTISTRTLIAVSFISSKRRPKPRLRKRQLRTLPPRVLQRLPHRLRRQMSAP
jgi:hypothetical protein